jgi:phosphate starvation-inducible PhoH-like protein
VTGDATQIDLPDKRASGLVRGIEIVKNIRGISVIEFDRDDIVRHPIVTKIVDAFEKYENGDN